VAKVDREENVDENKRKRPKKSEVRSSVAVDDGAVAAMVRGHLHV
jgi:hypothetical protein